MSLNLWNKLTISVPRKEHSHGISSSAWIVKCKLFDRSTLSGSRLRFPGEEFFQPLDSLWPLSMPVLSEGDRRWLVPFLWYPSLSQPSRGQFKRGVIKGYPIWREPEPREADVLNDSQPCELNKFSLTACWPESGVEQSVRYINRARSNRAKLCLTRLSDAFRRVLTCILRE